jgi:hypothetical protein
VAELRNSGNKWAADLSNRNSDVDAKLATLTSQIQNPNQMFPNQGTGKGSSRGLMDKMMIPEIYSDETSAPLTPWSDKMEAFLEDKHRGLRRVMTLCRKTKVGDIPGDVSQEHIMGMCSEVPWELSQQLYDFILNRSSGECYKVVKSVRDANGFEAWRQIHLAFDPKTVNTKQNLRAAIHACARHPAKKISEIRAVSNNLDTKIRLFEENDGSVFPQEDAVGILINLMPEEVQKHMALTPGLSNLSHREYKAKVFEYVNICRKQQMDIGIIQPEVPPKVEDAWDDTDPWAQAYALEAELSAFYKGKGKNKGKGKGKSNHDELECWQCGKKGHVGRNCPTNPYKGAKGGKGGGEPGGEGISEYIF